jgi:putative hemolysin
MRDELEAETITIWFKIKLNHPINKQRRKSLIYSAEQTPTKLAQTIMEQGFEPADLKLWRLSGVPDTVISIILEYYAFDAGRYCTEQARLACKAFMSIGIRTWMQQIKGWQQTSSEVKTETQEQKPSAKDISEAIACVFCFNTVDSNLVQGLIANEIGKAHPQLKAHMEAAKQLLPIPVQDELLSVTNLASLYIERRGKQLSKKNTNQGNAMAMNQILTNLGLQIKNPSPSAKKSGNHCIC